MNNLKRVVDYIITLVSGLNLSAANVTTATVVASTIGSAVYYVSSSKSQDTNSEGNLDQSSMLSEELKKNKESVPEQMI